METKHPTYQNSVFSHPLFSLRRDLGKAVEIRRNGLFTVETYLLRVGDPLKVFKNFCIAVVYRGMLRRGKKMKEK